MRRCRHRWCMIFLATLVAGAASPSVSAAPLTVVNAGFEDTSGQTVFNEFTFGTPAGWQIHDPNGLIPDADIFPGTLLPNGTDFFNTTAPEGNRVAILFNQGRRDEGEYGFVQALSDVLTANTRYTLRVEVGNIASGFATNGAFFNLDGFPGYRVDLLAVTLGGGGSITSSTVIAQDLDSLIIPEGEFATSVVTVDIGDTHANLGDNLAIRLVNLNETRGEPGPPDLEVDFDDVRLDAETIVLAAPQGALLLALAAGLLVLNRRLN